MVAILTASGLKDPSPVTPHVPPMHVIAESTLETLQGILANSRGRMSAPAP